VHPVSCIIRNSDTFKEKKDDPLGYISMSIPFLRELHRQREKNLLGYNNSRKTNRYNNNRKINI
jgi:hypothetical protein